MAKKEFRLVARVSSSKPNAIRPVLKRIITTGSVSEKNEEFVIEARMNGESAKELNRFLLSELRRAEKRTRLRSAWTSSDNVTESFFDYVLKRVTKA